MDLSRYDARGAITPSELAAKYLALQKELQRLLSAPVKDLAAVDAIIVELDEVQAGVKHSQKLPGDTQRY